MRLLFLSNFFPPASRGGYEEWCKEIAQNMRRRGHEIHVLTSRHGTKEISGSDSDWIHRELHLEMELASFRNGLAFFTARAARERENLVRLRRHFHNLNPDVVVIWGMWNLPRSLPGEAEKLMPGRVAYYMGDYWPTLPSQFQFYWEAPAQSWKTRIPKAVLSFFARQILAKESLPLPNFEHMLFPTQFMQAEFERLGVNYKHSTVIYGAADTSDYRRQKYALDLNKNAKITLLYAGRLIHDKGAHIAINTVSILVHQHGMTDIELLIVGSGDNDYEGYLSSLAEEKQVTKQVKFLGPCPKEEMPALYGRADIFLFTSIWPEPFGRVLIEAMATGIVVVGSATGGAAEILDDEVNSLIFAPEDANGAAQQILRLIESPTLYAKLSQTGYLCAKEDFGIKRMADEIESYIESGITK